MKILILNRGSSSLKCFLYDFIAEKASCPLWVAHLEWKNSFEEPFLSLKNNFGVSHYEKINTRTSKEALSYIMSCLVQGGSAILSSLSEIHVIGHRIVHGGNFFSESVVVTKDVKDKIRLLSELAPLHNLPELEGIEILETIFESTPQVAVFDTAFHHTLPESASIYPGPYRWYEQGIKRYGFHGISFQYCSKRAAEILNQDLKKLKMVICHLGSGASLCAVKEGISVDTTMGFTPLDGLMMDTRSGSIDPGIILHLLKKAKPEEIAKELFEDSGLLGISGFSSDMRDIIEKNLQGNPRASLAFTIYLHRLRSLIGSMIASLNGIDVLVFTAGIGENACLLREKICADFSFLGVCLDKKKNDHPTKEDRDLSSFDSKVKVLLVHTQEEYEIARECFKKVSKE